MTTSEHKSPSIPRQGIKMAPRRPAQANVEQAAPEPKIHKPQNSPEAARNALLRTLGGVVALLVDEPRYRNHTIADLQHLILEPLVRDRIQLVKFANSASGSGPEVAAAAIWASVSEDVNLKIQGQIKAGEFPVRLQPDDWTSGNVNWLLDVVSMSPDVASHVVAGFGRVTKSDKLSVHPIVSSSLDDATLGKLGVKKSFCAIKVI